ncbi:MAG: hypothetical protein ACUVWN_06230 [bacterium]
MSNTTFYRALKLSTFAFIFYVLSFSFAIAYFSNTGLIDIPAAYVMKNGIFNAGIYTAIYDQKREEIGIRADFGIFNFAESGIFILKNNDRDFFMGNFKLMLSRESGSIPALSVGLDNFGEKVTGNIKNNKPSLYIVTSKQFNLPLVHIIDGHIGLGNQRYITDDSFGIYLHGMFFGLRKDLIFSSQNSKLRLMGEVIGKDINAGIRYIMDTGLSIDLSFGQLNSNIKYYIGISLTNEPILRQISQASELAKNAARIANEKKY